MLIDLVLDGFMNSTEEINSFGLAPGWDVSGPEDTGDIDWSLFKASLRVNFDFVRHSKLPVNNFNILIWFY